MIQPLPTNSTSDAMDPFSYRGIPLASNVYTWYCSVLNTRHSTWAEVNQLIHDEQNGFRKRWSSADYLSILTSIMETQKQMRKNTCTAFIDYSKAYDQVDRKLLWSTMGSLGLGGKMIQAQKFSVNTGLKQILLSLHS